MERYRHRLINNMRLMVIAITTFSFCVSFAGWTDAQDSKSSTTVPSAGFRIGERLTYNVSFGKFSDVAYFETAVVSRGNLSGQEVVELRSRVRSREILSAAFFQLDEIRSVFVSPDTGFPVYSIRNINYAVEPKEIVDNFIKEPTSGFDLLSLIYKARQSNGTGSFPLNENGQHYTITFQPAGSEKVKTEAGEFDTVVSLVQSEYLTANGIKDLKINFTADEDHVPAVIRFKISNGIFTASLAAIQLPKPAATPSPEQSKTPLPDIVPPVKMTPTPYLENQPISPDLGFALGEELGYRVSAGGKAIATIALAVKERKMFQNEDSLLLTATVTGIEQGNTVFGLGDSIQVWVDPETLAPRWIETKFAGELKWLNQTAVIRKSGNILIGGKEKVDAPIGTQTILSLVYAMRSFNLKPSKDSTNPVNDTRVAVLWDSQPYVFTLVPSAPEEVTVGSEKILAQMISVKTGDEKLDKQGIKIWLTANQRIPLRFALGAYQADLIPPPKK